MASPMSGFLSLLARGASRVAGGSSASVARAASAGEVAAFSASSSRASAPASSSNSATPAPTSAHLREIAVAPRPDWSAFALADRVNRHVARSEGYLESASGARGRGAYALFDEMEEKDAHLHGILQTRRNGVLARPRRVEPASSEARDVAFAARVERALERVPEWEASLGRLLDAIARGFAVLEVVWGYDADGFVVPAELKPRAPWRFELGPRGELLLADDPYATKNDATSRALPDRKFLVMRHDASDERPYGRGLCERVYWYWWFKKNNLKFWALYNEKFGAPTVVAKHAPGLARGERERLLEVLSTLQADAGVVVPEGVELDLLESGRRGTADTYRELADWCNDEMSRGVLGQTLTTGEGRRSGSMALGRVHEAVRFDYVRADALLLMNALNATLLRWIADFNLGPGSAAPRWVVDLVPDLDVEVEAEIDRRLLQMGVPLPLRHFHEKYRRPAPAPGERSLRYDDSNLYQYHLQFGVLTVNEVRATLGLPRVEWGDRAPVPAGAGRGAGGGGARPKGGGNSRDDPEEREAEGDEVGRDRRGR